MHRSVDKITDENELLFSLQTKFAQQKAAIIPFNADNVISLACGRKKKFAHNSLSHFETLLLFYLLFILI